MSLIVVATTPKGIVIGGDSRCSSHKVTLGNEKIEVSDDETKVFQLSNHAGAGVTGAAEWTDPKKGGFESSINAIEFAKRLQDQTAKCKSFYSLTRTFADILREKYDIETQLKTLKKEFDETVGKAAREEGHKINRVELLRGTETDDAYQFIYGPGLLAYIEQKGEIESHVHFPLLKSAFFIAGYNNKDDSNPKVSYLRVPPGNPVKVSGSSKKDNYGLCYSGDTRVVTWATRYRGYKLKDVLYGVRYRSWPGLEHIDHEKLEDLVNEIRPKGEDINWGRLSLEKATDIVASMIEITKLLQEDFHKICPDQTINNPISVGGEIDIAVIEPQRGFYMHTIKSNKVK